MASNDGGFMALKDVFEQFKKSKLYVRKIHEDAINCFNDISRELSRPRDAEIAVELGCVSRTSTLASPDGQIAAMENVLLQFDRSLAQELYTQEEREAVESLFFQEPALIVVGQTNCGKSSIINQLLGVKAMPTSDHPSTARMVHVKYADQPFCHLVHRDGKILETIDMKGRNKIPRKKIELSKKDRENPAKVGCRVVAGLSIEFLKAGVMIIDSPGRNENDALDKLVQETLDNPLAFVIYVVDGRNLFTKQDRGVLSEITSRRLDLDIFFVVSKLEPEERELSDDEEPEQDTEARHVQMSKKQRVYERLVKNGFLSPQSGVSIEENDRFHGISAWKIQEYHEKKRRDQRWNDPDGSFAEYIAAFERFQTSVKAFARDCLRASVENACNVLIRVLSRCLDFFIQKANVLKKGKQRTMKMLDALRHQEEEVHENIKRNLEENSTDIKDLLCETFEGARVGILDEAAQFQYESTQLTIAQDGYVTSKEAVSQCKDQLQRMVVNRLQGEMKEMLIKMFHSRDQFVAQLRDRIVQIEEETAAEEGFLSAGRALARGLLSSYKVEISVSGRGGGVLQLLKKFGTRLYDALCSPIKTFMAAVKGKVQVGASSWKKKVAIEVLEKVDSAMMTDEIVNGLRAHFATCHDEFQGEVEKIKNVFKRGETIKDEQRRIVLKFAPSLALLEMLVYSVNDRFEFGLPRRGDMIGCGAQGKVYACENVKTSEGKPCVVKVVTVSGVEALKDLTVELHNTRFLHHPNILPIVCTIVEQNAHRGLDVSIISERMKCDLEKGLPNIPSLRVRLNIALDVAKALEFLHGQELIHRDVKVQNVLLDERNQAKLTDLGLCKPEGLANNSLVGTPLNMAPEIMIKRNYGKPVDVYAFGMLLWRVCEGKGNQPQNVHWDTQPLVMLIRNAIDNKTPERLDVFRDSCWNLMEKCWHRNPEERPSFHTVVKDLQDILCDPKIK